MTTEKFENALESLGPIGRNVAEKVKHLREAENLSFAELSRRLEAVNRQIPTLGLRKIEAGSRRVDVDDLVALAIVFDVSPLALLLPAEGATLTPNGKHYNRSQIWQWGQGTRPLDNADPVSVARFTKYSNPDEYEIALDRQALGKVNDNPVAVPRVAEKRVRERRTAAATSAAGVEHGND